MELALSLRIILLSVSALICFGLALFLFFNKEKDKIFYSFLGLLATVFVWLVCEIFRILFSGSKTYIYFLKCEFLGICFMGFTFLLFCLLYTKHKIVSTAKNIWLLSVPPILCYSSVLTNDYHYKFFFSYQDHYKQLGPLFWFHAFFSYLYIIWAIIVLIKFAIRQYDYAQRQSILLITATLVPFVFNVFSLVLYKVANAKYDNTALCFTITVLFLAAAVFKYRLLNIVPIALRKIVDNMRDAIIVLDKFNKVADYNSSFLRFFPEHKTIRRNDNIRLLIDTLINRAENINEVRQFLKALEEETIISSSFELNLINPKKLCLLVNIQPIISKNNDILGKVISFNDITEYKNLVTELEEKNTELEALNQQLQEYSSMVEELAIAKERNRFARDAHDTWGHRLTLLITMLDAIYVSCKDSAIKENLRKTIEIAREGMNEVRRSIAGLAPEKLEVNNLKEVLQTLVLDFQPSGVKVDLTVEGFSNYRDPVYSNVIYRVCQEALTNSLRHGKAKNVNIILRFTDDKVKFFIIDDGVGCKSIKKGFGLSGMEERVKEVKGKITFGSDGDKGFNIQGEIPLKKN